MRVYTNRQKDNMMDRIINIAEEITGQEWRSDGGYISNSEFTMSINIYDYMDDYYEHDEINNLKEYVEQLINEQREVE